MFKLLQTTSSAPSLLATAVLTRNIAVQFGNQNIVIPSVFGDDNDFTIFQSGTGNSAAPTQNDPNKNSEINRQESDLS